MSCKIIFAKSAEKNLQQIGAVLAERIVKKILEFSNDNPPVLRAKKLTNFKDAEYRFRVGDYRILFDYNETENKIEVLKIAHRKDVYE